MLTKSGKKSVGHSQDMLSNVKLHFFLQKNVQLVFEVLTARKEYCSTVIYFLFKEAESKTYCNLDKINIDPSRIRILIGYCTLEFLSSEVYVYV